VSASEQSRVDRDEHGQDNELLLSLGPLLLIRLSALMRTARTYDVSNQAFQRQLQECLSVIQTGLEEEQELVIATAAEYFYLNGVRIKAQASLLSVYHTLMAEFTMRSVGGVRFLQGVSAPELERFFQLFLAADNPSLAQRLPEAVAEASIECIVPLPPQEFDEEVALEKNPKNTSERSRAKRAFWNAVIGTKKIILHASQTGRADLRHAKRLVQPVVDNIMRHEYSIVGLTAVKEHDEYTYAHCVNVSILSVSMGHVLGLSRQTLADLGVAGLLHDIGKLAVPGDVLRKPGALSSEEWTMMRRHPIEGVKMMIRMPGLSTLTLDSMRVCFEHHMNFDRTGYPEVAHEWGQATMSRIVAVADCFDAMTAHRAYHKRALSAFEALQILLGPNRVQFDPAALWALVKTVGLYPPGSVVLTRSGHVALALSPNPDDLRHPYCRVLALPDGTMVPEETPIEWSPMTADEAVMRVLLPEEYSIQTGEYLAA